MDIPTTTASEAPHESVCKTETTPTSSYHETGRTRANEGEAGEKSNHTASKDPKQNVPQKQATKKFCTFAVNNGLTGSPGLPPELRLMVYKAAFPEMGPSIVYEKPDGYAKNQLVFIGPFLTEYVRQVQFCCKPRYHYHHDREHRDLQQFLSILAASNLIGSFRYLTILVPWNRIMAVYKPRPKLDAIHIAYILTILYRYKLKCELTFYHYNTRILRRLLDHIVEIGQTNPLRTGIGNSDQGSRSNFADFLMASWDFASQDKVLDKLSRRLTREVKRTQTAKAENKYDVLKYPIDFSK
ncbi:hypothetical protein COCCADRAFT_36168 [Bipolaris zeicola 26-R-13]|uniref:Uncharacterized protein n=1 Tax=Cochliobolus carbonum (strain 26-R-13) TaxID=930089 RepID=W6Y9B6_COCC2|nr:uncharacterized protein COCCADRAFT_36168 [Bipolaris zeicola 26-R-13]EUC34110.1 hypothetical protein COCCADRAFT_36168 [Bipolaris zeicola 26-R-13]